MGYWRKQYDKPKGNYKPKRDAVWFDFIDEKKQIKRYMNANEAERWMKETGKPVFLKAKAFEL